MVNYLTDPLDTTFSALSDPTRRAILARLAQGESTVTELARPFQVSLPAISKHLRVLESAGLLSRKRDGRVHRCRLNARPMKEAADWMRHYRKFWEDRLDALAEYLEGVQEEEETSWPKAEPPKPPVNQRQKPKGRKNHDAGQRRNR